jgi:hypothetical protein
MFHESPPMICPMILGFIFFPLSLFGENYINPKCLKRIMVIVGALHWWLDKI